MADRKAIQVQDGLGNLYDIKDAKAQEDIAELKSAINDIDDAVFDMDTMVTIDSSARGTVLDRVYVNDDGSTEDTLQIKVSTGKALWYSVPAEKSGKVFVKSVDTTHGITITVTKLVNPVITLSGISITNVPIDGGYTYTETITGEEVNVQQGDTVLVAYNRAYSFNITGNIFKNRELLSENVMTQIDDEAEEVARGLIATATEVDNAPTKDSTKFLTSGTVYDTLEGYVSKEIIGTGTNKFNKDDPENQDGYVLNSETGAVGANASYYTTYFIPVTPGKPYTLYNPYHTSGSGVGGRAYVFYDSQKNYISGSDTFSSTLTAPTDSAYVRMSFSSSAQNNVMLLEDKYYNNVTYESYKTIRQVEDDIVVPKSISPFHVSGSKSKNQYNPNDIVANSALSDDGYRIYNTSYFTSNAVYCGGYDVLIYAHEILDGDTASATVMKLRNIAFYDETKNLIATYPNANDNFPNLTFVYGVNGYSYSRISIPSGAFWAILGYQSSDTTRNRMIYCANGQNAFPLYPYEAYTSALIMKNDIVPYDTYVKTPFSGKTLNVIGDSITYGFGTYTTLQKAFPYLTGYNLNMSVNNYGINSSELAERSAGDTTHDPMCIRYTDMVDADIVVVAGGTNDWEHAAVTLGQMGDTATTTFYGALDTMCKGLIQKYPDKIIIFMTPIKRSTYYNPNSLGYMEAQFADAIKEVCAFYGIPVLDMFEKCTINPTIEVNRAKWLVDNTHPNQAGHVYIASMLTGFISSLIQNSYVN